MLLTEGTPSAASLSSSLICRLPASIDDLKPTTSPEPTPAPAPLAFTKELFKLFMQTYIDTIKYQFQAHAPLVEPKKQLLKARFPDLYFEILYLDYYWFYQKFEDHFTTAKVN